MNYIFPYEKVERGSKIALYGAGNVGIDFFLQLCRKKYCKVEAWIDEKFESYEYLEKPFARKDKISDINFDMIIIAVQNYNDADKIKKELIEKYHILEEKIVWSDDYEIKTDLFPKNWNKILQKPDIFMEIIEKYEKANSIYGGGGFYQSFTEIGINGTRNTQDRINLYKIKDFLDKDSKVLDIGCNCGFLDLQVAPLVGQIDAIDIEPLFIEIADIAKEYCNIKNVHFMCKDFYNNTLNTKYDAIFAFAVYTNIMVSGASEEEVVELIYNQLNTNGFLFFESHNLKNNRMLYNRLCKKFITKGMKICLHENYFSDFERDIIVFQK